MKKIASFLVLFTICVSAQEKSFITEELSVSEFLKGSLYTPENSNKTNLVILIAGSGPTDRNGNNPMMQNNSLKFLAEGLAKNNISAYSYDKRFFSDMFDENFDESKLVFEDFIDDAIEVITFFKNQNKYNKIIFAGHSEGSLIGMVATQKAKADGFVSISGPGNSFDVIIEEQISKNAPFLLEETKSILEELKKGNTVELENTMLMSVFGPSVQPFLISCIKYIPQSEIKKLNVPVMIVQGDSDLQVAVSEAELLQKAKPKAKYLIVEKMNHILKEVNDLAENQSSYGNPNLPVSPELIKEISSFVKGI